MTTGPAHGPAAPSPGGARARRMVALIALVVAAPVLLSYAFYYLAPRGSFTNYGELLPTQPFPRVGGTLPDGRAFDLAASRQWTIVIVAPAACDEACAKTLYATRQARMIQGKEMDRVARVWLATGEGAPPAALAGEHPDVLAVRGAEHAALPRGTQAVYLVDPLGNQVLAWPRDPDIKAMSKDLGRVLKASRIG